MDYEARAAERAEAYLGSTFSTAGKRGEAGAADRASQPMVCEKSRDTSERPGSRKALAVWWELPQFL